jgi:hypothetical protein
VGLEEGQEGLAFGFGDTGEPERASADEQPLAPGVAVGADDRMLGRLGDRRPVGGAIARVRAVDGDSSSSFTGWDSPS